jgi:hypothetical protein
MQKKSQYSDPGRVGLAPPAGWARARAGQGYAQLTDLSRPGPEYSGRGGKPGGRVAGYVFMHPPAETLQPDPEDGDQRSGVPLKV